MEPATSRAPRSRFVVWLHGLGDTGRANEFLADSFPTTAAFADARWAFPTAPTAPVTCNRGMLMPSWFDIHDAPITSVRYLCHNENSPVYAMLAEARKGTIVMFT
ncbi:Os04g0669700 [Oryza sativa Japonica Group]|uniref:Os04g0669700 protein n=2 Tax=Oryza TaxID=4527 RepID=A0A0P0WG18_ORYSJ|nr:hypothetical protein EE612_026171 [Oryza sativa]BAS91546.1 Os04g0669700 [Oryza sativa Japonica Group]